jgi:RHS repeat-associated protein
VTLTTDVATNHITGSIATYDDRGNVFSFSGSAGGQYHYHDLINRLYRTTDSTSTPSTDFTYLYDGSGERIAKFPSGGGATRREFARLIMEARGDILQGCPSDPFPPGFTCASNPNDGKYVYEMKYIGITGGCGGGTDFCAESQTPRDQAAVFFLKGKWCGVNQPNCNYQPPSCLNNPQFLDVPCPATQQEPYSDWIGELAHEQITAGCGSGNFCPGQALGSWQMLAWASKIWAGYDPLPRASVVTYRDEGSRVITEGVESLGSGDATAVEAYQRDNVFLGNQLVASTVWSNAPYWNTLNYDYYAVDHLGSVRLATVLSNSNYQTLHSLKFWPYGDPVSGNSSDQRLQFDGMEQDLENEQYYDHARTYDFNIGRFLSADVISGESSTPQSWNRYSFVTNTPLRLTDPRGLFTSTVLCETIDGKMKCHLIPPGGPDSDPNPPTGTGSGDDPPKPHPCLSIPSNGPHGVSAGAGVSGSIEAGNGTSGGALTGSAGGGLFLNGFPKLPTTGAFAAFGGFVGSSGPSFPQSSDSNLANRVNGAYVGGGPFIWVSNAGDQAQLSGAFHVFNFNAGFGEREGSVQLAFDSNGTLMFSLSVAPIPGVGYGVSVSSYNTCTLVRKN